MSNTVHPIFEPVIAAARGAAEQANDAKNTPGPWRAVDAGDGYEIWSSSPHMSATVATLVARRSVTGRADAHLIAAAPDMLAALTAALPHIERIAATTPTTPTRAQRQQEAAKAASAIRAAIAKATGR